MSTTMPGPSTGTLSYLERTFHIQERGSTWRTEILAGATTFLTMAYIVFVNPGILSEAGMPVPAVAAATCLSAAIGCILMGLIANYPDCARARAWDSMRTLPLPWSRGWVFPGERRWAVCLSPAVFFFC